MSRSFGCGCFSEATMAPPRQASQKRSPVSTYPGWISRQANLTARLINVAEEERRHLARELHDDIGQRLSLLTVTLDILKNDLGAEESIREKVEHALRELKDLAQDIHNLSHRLHSSKLQHLGLPAALKEVCRQIGGQHRVAIDLQTSEACPTLSDDVSLCFYRVAQEALNNAVKHSRSDRVEVRLDSAQDRVRLQVKDFGIGFDPTLRSDGLGLATMHERLGMVGGTLSIKSSIGKGTDLRAEAGVRGARILSMPHHLADGSKTSQRQSSTARDRGKTDTKKRASARAIPDQHDRLHRTLQEMHAQSARLRELVHETLKILRS
jgi:signal transduction histidine kinase